MTNRVFQKILGFKINQTTRDISLEMNELFRIISREIFIGQPFVTEWPMDYHWQMQCLRTTRQLGLIHHKVMYIQTAYFCIHFKNELPVWNLFILQ